MRPSLFLSGLMGLQCGTAAFQGGQNRRMMLHTRQLHARGTGDVAVTDVNPRKLYPAHNFSVPIDHFHNDTTYAPHTDDKFPMRYWFDDTYYKPGGPVFVLLGGETSGADRLPFIQKGILYLLSRATGGLSVVLEHRYYGTSQPTPNLNSSNLRFLTTEQAMADTAYFAKNVVFQGHNADEVSPQNTPWILYGGSYAGGMVAFLRKLYPDVFWGGIASSAVTEAIVDYWAYFEAQRRYAPPACVRVTEALTKVVDDILITSVPSNVARLKTFFGLPNVTNSADFAMVLSDGITAWQGMNWDPSVGSLSFGRYCGNMTADKLLWPRMANQTAVAERILQEGGVDTRTGVLVNNILNYAGWIRATHRCSPPDTQDQCYSQLNETFFAADDIDQWPWRSWTYQVCTQWGYYQTGSSPSPPLVSRLLDIPFLSFACQSGFGFPTTQLPDVAAINKHGGFNLSYPRLAFVDGEADAWREATPHALAAPRRTSTLSEPFILIEGAGHHWDENGLFDNQTTAELPPDPVRKAQEAEVRFVKAWLQEWEVEKGRTQDADGQQMLRRPMA